MIKSLGQELKMRANYCQEPIETIYFGGGTPSILEIADIKYLLTVIFDNYEANQVAEITLEANPEDMTAAKLEQWIEAGIERLSIGIQTFSDDKLKAINRAHTADRARKALQAVEVVGYENYSCDLIYAIPPYDLEIWKRDLDEVMAFQPPHISMYSLTIEPKTVFGSRLKQGKLHELTDEENATQYDLTVQQLSKAGYLHYEVSNFCKPGFQSRHNTNYWRGESYLGIGPGAHSFDQKSRYWNVANNHLYIKSISKGELPLTSERLNATAQANEYILTRLRTWMGIDFDHLKSSFGLDLRESQNSYISWLLQSKYAEQDGSTLRLTDDGLARADEITLKFFQDDT